jgi:hypothetical protein
MTVILPRIRIQAAEEGPSDTSGDAVINTDLVFNDDLAPGVRGHQRHPEKAAALRGRTYVHNGSNGQKYQMVLSCPIHGAKRLHFGFELNRLVGWEKLVKMGS